MATITHTGRKLFTLNPDGSDMVQLQDPGEFTKNSIGERKRVELSFNSSDSIISSQIYFDPALFLQEGSITPAPFAPAQGWTYNISPSIVPGSYNMVLIVPPSYTAGIVKNWQAKFIYIDTTNFEIHLEYFQMYDTLSYQDASINENTGKLLRDVAVVPPGPSTPLSIPSVYMDASFVPNFYVYINYAAPGVSAYYNVELTDYQAAYYNYNPLLAAPYFSSPSWLLEVGGSPVSTLQLHIDTKVTFKISAANTVDKVVIWLIKTNANDNTSDFITAYDASYLKISNNPGTGTLDNKIKAPSTEPTVVGLFYETTFYVDHTQLAFGEKYAFIAVVYENGYGNVEVNSFMSEEYILNQLPRFTGVGYNFTGKLEDYVREYNGNDLIAVVEERMKSSLLVDYEYNAFSGDMNERLGLSVSNNIKRYLTQIKVEVYSDDSSGGNTIINYYDRLTATKIDPINYNVPAGMVLNFNIEELEVEYSFRNRYEYWIANIETVYNGVVITPQQNQNWAGRDLFIKYSLELFYDDYTTPFSDTIIFEQKLHPKTYASVIITDDEGNEIGDKEYFCNDLDQVCFIANLVGIPNPEDYDLIVNIEPSLGNSPTIEEQELWAGGSSLVELYTPKVSSEDISFDVSGEADFCISPPEFLLNLLYKISAIAKLRDTCVRITEDDFLRLEEDDAIRIMEEC